MICERERERIDGKNVEWKKGKGDRRECANYRGRSILNMLRKIYGRA